MVQRRAATSAASLLNKSACSEPCKGTGLGRIRAKPDARSIGRQRDLTHGNHQFGILAEELFKRGTERQNEKPKRRKDEGQRTRQPEVEPKTTSQIREYFHGS